MGTRTKLLAAFSIVTLGVLAAVTWWLNQDTVAEVSLDQALQDNAVTNAVTDTPLELDGSWRVSDTAESFAGVRIDEELRGVGAITAVLRTPNVTGTLTLANGVLQDLSIIVDLTTLSSDDPRRDRAIRTALDFANFPTATFTLDTPVDVTALADGPFTFDAPGTLTINGVSETVIATVTADTTVGAFVAVAQLPVTFADFSVRLPSAPIVLSISDQGIIETQLRFVPN